jgi:hypothetical protein
MRSGPVSPVQDRELRRGRGHQLLDLMEQAVCVPRTSDVTTAHARLRSNRLASGRLEASPSTPQPVGAGLHQVAARSPGKATSVQSGSEGGDGPRGHLKPRGPGLLKSGRLATLRADAFARRLPVDDAARSEARRAASLPCGVADRCHGRRVPGDGSGRPGFRVRRLGPSLCELYGWPQTFA